MVVTEDRVVVSDGDERVADFPRPVVDASWAAPNELVLAVVDERRSLRVPTEEQEHAAQVLAALRHEPFVATLDTVDLPQRSRRALELDTYGHCALVLTRERLLLLVRRHTRTEIALSCPRTAIRVRAHETVWPGGDLLFDRIVLEAAGKPVELDVDQRLHDRACEVVAALGGTSDPPATGTADP